MLAHPCVRACHCALAQVRGHYAEAWYCSAVCALKLEDDDAALADFRRVVAIDPQHPQAWASLAALFAKKTQVSVVARASPPRHTTPHHGFSPTTTPHSDRPTDRPIPSHPIPSHPTPSCPAQRKEALFAYRESCRLHPASPIFWHGSAISPIFWHGSAMVSLELALFEEATFSAKRALELGGAPDAELASILAQAAAKGVTPLEGVSGSKLQPKVPRSPPIAHARTPA